MSPLRLVTHPLAHRGGLAGASRAALGAGLALLRQVARARGWAYDAGLLAVERLPVPVLSVGNLSLGGTGKTPLVEELTRRCLARGHRPGVASRGYGGGDEVRVLARNLPGVPQEAEPDRRAAARRLMEVHGCDVVILDDGFQHRRLARDLDLCVVDATDPFGLRTCPVGGLLREPAAALARADLLAVSRVDALDPAALEALEASLAALTAAPRVRLRTEVAGVSDLAGEDLGGVEWLEGRAVAAFCGLGSPEVFRRTLEASGARVEAFHAFPDHHPYDGRDLEALRAWGPGLARVTTQKDAVKL
ncbi:MAG: tetraacyldisaccharide 4'-kinase, partial [Planctomycetes bacterium]|nr:tetraacyldisaccharide 4'-kinase [Planctomycetota bacterium]